MEQKSEHLVIHFEDNSWLTIEPGEDGLSVILHEVLPGNLNRPTPRQREYLEFIRRFTALHGVSPAEADIQRHFMVSAPSVHEMIKTLERRGFISRDRDLLGQTRPRSIRVLV